MIEKDIEYMAKAIDVSKKSVDSANGKQVGCVIVRKNVIVGTGFRNLFVVKDSPYIDICFHAEHIALMEAGDNANGGTLYVTMEPCKHRHHGAWNKYEPPLNCSEMIVKAGIKRVVYIHTDEGEGGGGKYFLIESGVEVNQFFLT
jgi:diaminohydroxyphosphoribosylaminopyrimidine deaminase/5-amino-6-(5-phosphoribosylamino)uracil reductase